MDVSDTSGELNASDRYGVKWLDGDVKKRVNGVALAWIWLMTGLIRLD